MSEQEVLGIAAGIIFLVLGGALITRYKKLSSHRYFQYLIIIVALILLAFGFYLAGRSIYKYG